MCILLWTCTGSAHAVQMNTKPGACIQDTQDTQTWSQLLTRLRSSQLHAHADTQDTDSAMTHTTIQSIHTHSVIHTNLNIEIMNKLHTGQIDNKQVIHFDTISHCYQLQVCIFNGYWDMADWKVSRSIWQSALTHNPHIHIGQSYT